MNCAALMLWLLSKFVENSAACACGNKIKYRLGSSVENP